MRVCRGEGLGGTIYGLHGRAVKAPAHHGVDAQHLFTAMLDDLVATLPAPVAEGELPCVSVAFGRADQARHHPVGDPEG